MSTSPLGLEPLAVSVTFTKDALRVLLADGREIAVPLAWFPRLQAASDKKLQNWRLIGGGVGIHWPDLDEDISVEGLLAIRSSGGSRGGTGRDTTMDTETSESR